MKKLLIIAAMAGGLLTSSGLKAAAQSQEIQQLILDIQKLSELKKILKEMEQGYQVLSKGYRAINTLSKNNFKLHEVFLDGLLVVSPAVRHYYKVADIINNQIAIVREYKSAFSRFKRAGLFNAGEIAYFGTIYNKLFQQSLDKLNELTMVITDSKARMNDGERLAAIDRIDDAMQDKLDFLRTFDSRTLIQALQRAKASNDNKSLQVLYGINQ